MQFNAIYRDPLNYRYYLNYRYCKLNWNEKKLSQIVLYQKFYSYRKKDSQ
jgi:hypothetical protein